MNRERTPRVGPPLAIRQAIEYLLGIGLVLLALHGNADGHLLVVIVGAACLLLAAFTKGALGGVHLLGPRAHRVATVVIAIAAAVALIATGQFTRLAVVVPVIAAIAVLIRLALMGPPPAKRPKGQGAISGMSAEDVGRMAGRASGQLVRRWRERDR